MKIITKGVLVAGFALVATAGMTGIASSALSPVSAYGTKL